MSTKIDIVSGFLGAGKTTLIKKLLSEKLSSEKVVLIENEFGEIGIDGGILKNSGIEIKEMNSGCICCSLVGSFSASLKEVLKRYKPDRIIIEPSGVGKLSGVIEACRKMEKQEDVAVNMCIAVVDAVKYMIYINNFGEFFGDQLKYAKTIILSRTQMMQQDKLSAVVKDIQRRNTKANIVTTDWSKLDGADIVSLAEQDSSISLENQLTMKVRLRRFTAIEGNQHAHRTHQSVFQSWGVETPRVFSESELRSILKGLDIKKRGNILRAKGIVALEDGNWVQFDFVPGEMELKPICPDYTGRICVIGEGLDAAQLTAYFKV